MKYLIRMLAALFFLSSFGVTYVNASDDKIVTTARPYLKSTPYYKTGKVYGTVPKGTTLSVLEKTNKYYVKVRYKEKTGYISTRFIKYTDGSQTNKQQQQRNQQSWSIRRPQAAQANQIIEHLEKENISKTRLDIIKAGFKYLGTPYVYGSNRSTTKTFDSSDIIRQAFLEGAGLDTGGDHRKQAAYFKKYGKITTNWNKLKPGDHVFMMSYKGYKKSDYEGINRFKQRITHGGIYLGHGKILHSYSKESGGVRIDSVEGTHWKYRFIFGGNVVK